MRAVMILKLHQAAWIDTRCLAAILIGMSASSLALVINFGNASPFKN